MASVASAVNVASAVAHDRNARATPFEIYPPNTGGPQIAGPPIRFPAGRGKKRAEPVDSSCNDLEREKPMTVRNRFHTRTVLTWLIV